MSLCTWTGYKAVENTSENQEEKYKKKFSMRQAILILSLLLSFQGFSQTIVDQSQIEKCESASDPTGPPTTNDGCSHWRNTTTELHWIYETRNGVVDWYLRDTFTYTRINDLSERDLIQDPMDGDVAYNTNNCAPNLSFYHNGLWSLPVQLGTKIDLGDVLFVGTEGNNTAALRGDPSCEWQTINSSMPFLSGDVVRSYNGNYVLTDQFELDGEVSFDMRNSNLTQGLAFEQFIPRVGNRFRFDIDTLTLFNQDVNSRFFQNQNAGSLVDWDLSIKANHISGNAQGATTWGRNVLTYFAGNNFFLDVKTIDYFGQDLALLAGKNHNIKIGHARFLDESATGEFDEAIFQVRDVISGGYVDAHIGTFENIGTDGEKRGLMSFGRGFQNYNVSLVCDNYKSNAIRLQGPTKYQQVDGADYANIFIGLNSTTDISVSSNFNIHYKNIQGENRTIFSRWKSINGTYHYKIDNAKVIDRLIHFTSAGNDNRFTNDNVVFDFVNIDCINAPVITSQVVTINNTNFTIKGDKWTVDDHPLYLFGFDIENGSELKIDINDINCNQPIVFHNISLSVDSDLIIEINSTVDAAEPVIEFIGSTILGDVVIQNSTLVNDGTVAAIESDSPINIIIKSVFTNVEDTNSDSDVTELVSPVNRDANTK